MFKKKFLFFLYGIFLLLCVIFLWTNKNKQTLKMMSVSPYTTAVYNPPTQTPTPTPAGLSLDMIDWDTNHWKTYTGSPIDSNGKYFFSIKYPPTWTFNKEDLGGLYYPFGKTDGELNSPSVRLGTGGHEGGPPVYNRSFPAGNALYGWEVINKRVYGSAVFYYGNKQYIFEMDYLPIKNTQESDKLKQIFDTMLTTFQPVY